MLSNPRGRPAAPFWRSLLTPALGGLALAMAFPPLRLWPLLFVAWVPLWVELDRSLASPGGRRFPTSRPPRRG